MNLHRFIIACLLVLAGIPAASQPGTAGAGEALAPATRLAVSQHKTTHLVFPFAIKAVDRGSAAILVQQAVPVENILRVKAAAAHFRETSLTVVTADGALYAFAVCYAEEPPALVIRLPEELPVTRPDAVFSGAGDNEATVQRGAEQVLALPATRSIRKHNSGITLELDQVSAREEVMYCRVRIRNKSTVSYEPDRLRFFIRDRKRPRRTASQEVEVKPLYVLGSPARVAGLSEQVLVFALPKTMVPREKYILVRLMEKNGGRHLQLRVPHAALLRAKALAPEDQPIDTLNAKSHERKEL